MSWLKGIAEWVESDTDTAFVSIPFTWLLPVAYQRCVFLRAQGWHVRAGGPAVSLRPSFLGDVAEIGGEVEALSHHNPDATFTSRGCPNKCSFCAVPTIEGDLLELRDWEPKPIVCDNNLLACSRRHFDDVIDRLKAIRQVDFNQGLDARLLAAYHAARLAELDLKKVRLAWDHVSDEPHVMRAVETLNRFGFGNHDIGVYVLIGFEDSPDDALYRLDKLKVLGIRPNVMRFQPLWALRKNEYVAPGWTEAELRRFCRYWNRQNWLSKVPFEEYVR